MKIKLGGIEICKCDFYVFTIKMKVGNNAINQWEASIAKS